MRLFSILFLIVFSNISFGSAYNPSEIFLEGRRTVSSSIQAPRTVEALPSPLDRTIQTFLEKARALIGRGVWIAETPGSTLIWDESQNYEVPGFTEARHADRNHFLTLFGNWMNINSPSYMSVVWEALEALEAGNFRMACWEYILLCFWQTGALQQDEITELFHYLDFHPEDGWTPLWVLESERRAPNIGDIYLEVDTEDNTLIHAGIVHEIYNDSFQISDISRFSTHVSMRIIDNDDIDVDGTIRFLSFHKAIEVIKKLYASDYFFARDTDSYIIRNLVPNLKEEIFSNLIKELESTDIECFISCTNSEMSGRILSTGDDVESFKKLVFAAYFVSEYQRVLISLINKYLGAG